MNNTVLAAIGKLVEESSVKPMLVCPAQAATMLGCSRVTIYSLIKKGLLKTAAIGADRNRVTVASIEAFIKNGGSKEDK